MAKRALVILADGFEEIEAATPIDVLRRAQVDVVVAGLNDIKVKGSRGLVVMADMKLDAVRGEFDALILPGGSLGAKNLAVSEKVKALIKKMNDSGKIVAAICASPAIVLNQTGVLKNKKATCYPGMQGNFYSDVKYKEEDVVSDGNIITSRGPGTAMAFALSLVEDLAGFNMRDELKKALVLE